MFLVVAFSSSLDVAAIEMEMGLPLDYNKELMTVGVANVFSGLTGGYTGSYIFSQTVFTMRRGVYTRLNGYVVVLCEGLMIMLPISIISYLPKLFFGSLLVLISTDLMCEWLWAARHKMAPMEFAVCLLTFVAIQATGIEVGKLSFHCSLVCGEWCCLELSLNG
jgi:SulP family sulfate permease